MDSYLEQLNAQQRDAVIYTGGPELVIAGAGSGKTRVLTYKIVHLIKQGYLPWRMMALTFTNKAAREMKERIVPLVGQDVANKLWMGTFHSIFYRILRINADCIGFKRDFTIYDTSDSLSLIKQIVKDRQLDDKLYKPSMLQAHISNVKNAMISPDDYACNKELIEEDKHFNRPLTVNIYRTYVERCHIAGAMDFDDLLFYTNLILRDNPDVLHKYQEYFQYILVDEYQDTNFAQYLIIKQLSNQRKMFCIVGDDAQSIYSFRGANISNILGLQKQYTDLKIFKLEQNYRSSQNIIAAANSLIEKNKHQIRKHIFSENEVGRKVQVIRCVSEYEESYVIANTIANLKRQQGSSWDDFAVLYRTNAQSRIIEKALSSGGLKDDHGNTRLGIPYRIYGGLAFYQRKEVKDAICYFRMAQNPNDDEALRRVINYPTRGIGATTVGKVQRCAIEHGVSMWQVINAPQQYSLDVNKATLNKLSAFQSLIQHFVELSETETNAYEVAQEIIEKSRLLSNLISDNTPENISRMENLNELLNSTQEFVESKREEMGDQGIKLSDYMREASLATDQDASEKNGPCVTLMTVHAAKGLEFKNILISGVEEGRFPSHKSQDSLAEIEEERRLLYVAITRAKTTCTIFYAETIMMNGQPNLVKPSRFIKDIDPKYLKMDRTSFVSGNESVNFNEERFSWWGKPKKYDLQAPAKSNYQPVSPQLSTTRRVAPTPTASGGNYAVHGVEEIKEGQTISHSRFGQGTVISIDTASDPKIMVKFNLVGIKTLLLKFAKFEIVK